jgi:hypothetical protein
VSGTAITQFEKR